MKCLCAENMRCFYSAYKYGCGIPAKMINMTIKIVILKLKIIDLDVEVG